MSEKKTSTAKTAAKKTATAKTAAKKTTSAKKITTNTSSVKDKDVVVKKKIEKKLEGFDWNESNDYSSGYSKKERDDLEKLYKDSASLVNA